MLRVILLLCLFGLSLEAAQLRWLHLSTASSQLPLSSTAKIQSGSLIGDFDADKTNDFILAFADAAPALVLYRGATNWTTLPIELDFLPIATGGAAMDIDQDGDLDIVFGSRDGPEIWWWENPSPDFDAEKSWKRRTLRTEGPPGNSVQFAADLLGTARPQLLYWNHGSNALYHAAVPHEVQSKSNWVSTQIFAPPSLAPDSHRTLAAVDMNIDGLIDLLAGSYWLKRADTFNFTPTRISTTPGLSAIGRFRQSTYPQIVIAPQTSRGRVFWYECKTDPDNPESWAGRQLLGHDIAPAATLAIADLNKDGHDDILLTESRQPSHTTTEHAPNAWIIYSDGNGNFRPTLFWSDLEIFAAKIADLDADGDLDILSTPHTSDTPRLDLWLNTTDFTAPPTAPQ